MSRSSTPCPSDIAPPSPRRCVAAAQENITTLDRCLWPGQHVPARGEHDNRLTDPSASSKTMTDRDQASIDRRQSLHQYVSDRALAVLSASPDSGWVSIAGSLAFFDISGFTKLTERLASLGRSGAEHINDVLNAVFAGLIDEVFRYGGDVLEFGGDAMVVLFTGEQHPRRAAAAATDMFQWMSSNGRVTTPAGSVRLSMSCGLATGEQAYHVLGHTRRALVVAGPVSSAMASLEGIANAGEALVDEAMAQALPRSWVERRRGDGRPRLRF